MAGSAELGGSNSENSRIADFLIQSIELKVVPNAADAASLESVSSHLSG